MNPIKSTVKRSKLTGKKIPEALQDLNTTCSAGAQCPEVTSSAVASAALADLQVAVVTATKSEGTASQARATASAAETQAAKDFKVVRLTLCTYETAVVGVADGQASVITKSGLEARPEAPAATPTPGQVVNLSSQPWKLLAQAKIRWPEMPGAAMYAVQVSTNLQAPTGPFTSLGTTTRRTKVVQTPTPGGQLLVQVAAVDSDGVQAEWSIPILATGR